MNPTRQMLLGAFFVIVLGILGYTTLFLTDFSWFKPEWTVVVHFPDANGLRQGDSVHVAGLRKGRVKTAIFDPTAPVESRITVTLKMDEKLELREGFVIAIEDSTLLGGKFVMIDPGPPGAAPVLSNKPLAGTVRLGALASIGELVDQNRARVSSFLTNLEAVMNDLQAGKGTFGRLLKDDELGASLKDGVAKLQRTADNLALLTDDLRAGKGALGRLFSDEELSKQLGEIGTRLSAITDYLQSVTKDLSEGKGTIGRLLKDEQLSEDVAKAVASIRATVERIQSGEGAFGVLVNDPQIGADLKAAIAKFAQVADDLAVATDAIRNAKGSIGMLVMDDQLYEQIQRALLIITGALEEFREASPITAFVSILFSVF